MAEDEAAALLAQLGISGGGGAAKKKKKKPAGAKAAEGADGEDIAQAESAPAETAVAAPATTEEAGGSDDEDNKAEGSGAAAKKKKKKKAGAAAAEKAEAAPAPEPAQPKLSAVARKALEAQERARKAKEEQERLEQLAREAEEAEKRAEEERMRKEEEEREERRRKKEEKKQRAIAEGKPVTKAEKEKARKLAEARARLLSMGMVPTGLKRDGDEEEGEDQEKKEKKEKKKDKEKKKKKKYEDETEVNATEESASKEPEPAPETAAPPQPAEESDKDWDDDDTDLLAQLKSKKEDEKVVLTESIKASAPAPATSSSSKSESKKKSSKKKEEKASKSKKKSKKVESDSDSDDDDDDDYEVDAELRQRIHSARKARLARLDAARVAAVKRDQLRSPICCVLGHVDTGKTKTLDMLRKTNVQEGEAGGITQQIGATFFPAQNIQLVVDRLPEDEREKFSIPGLLVIDTPGHEAFSNLRSRGSGLADVAILVIDIMHGLEQQTVESIELLRKRQTAFVVALNKVDRLYGWQTTAGCPIQETLAKQKTHTQQEFDTRVKAVITQLMEKGLNAKLYWENDSPEDTVSICPTSAITGEGSPDLINQVVRLAQTQKRARIAYSDELECTVLEVKKIEGLGTTIDVCLVNGTLNNDDMLVLATFTGPLVTQVRSLLTPQPMKEMRVKGEYIQHSEIKGAMGIKITCQAELENVVAGTSVFKVTSEDDTEELKDAVMKDVADNLKDIQTVDRGVFVQCSTLGSLEGMMVHLRKENIPVAGVAVGPVRKKDITRASAMLETKHGDPDLFEKEYASVLAFNIKIDPAARDLAEELGVKIFADETIYNLTDQYIAYAKQMREERRRLAAGKAVFPCILRIVPGCVFNSKNPIVIGVEVVRGCLMEGTPVVVPEKFVPDPDNEGQKMMLELGRVASIEKDHVKVPKASRGDKVCIKIQGSQKEANIQVGRHFEESNNIVSKISRKSIDVLKSFFKEDVDALKDEGWALIQNELKKTFNIK